MTQITRSLFALLILLFVAISCETEENQLENGKIAFSFESLRSSMGGRKSTAEEPHFLLVTIENGSGAKVYDRQEIELFAFGSEFLSEPIELLSGGYILTEFLVLNADNKVLYATPLEGSKLAHLVVDPLPISINIVRDQTSKITPQVVAIDEFNHAEDFGYTTFSFNVVETISFQLAVFVYDSAVHNFELTTSDVKVMANTDLLYNDYLPDSTNRVAIKKGYGAYTLQVSKAGYTTFEASFTEEELLKYYSNEVLIVKLVDPSQSINYALQLDGIDDFVEFGDIYDSLQFPITVSAWVKIDPSIQYTAPIFVSQDNAPLYNGFWLGASKTHVFIEYGDGRGENSTVFRRGKTAYVGSNITSEWIHVCGIMRGPFDMDVYVNGVNVGGDSSGDSYSPMSSNYPNDVARSGRWMSNGLDIFFKGYMDEVTVWNKSLSADEVNYYKNHKASSGVPGLVGYWDFDEAAGEVVLDKSLNHFNGSIHGGATRVPSGAQIQ